MVGLLHTSEARVGVDLVEISRLETIAVRTPGFFRRVFTTEERSYCEHASHPFEHYAARFAAREACLKALGIGWAPGVRFQDVSVHVDEFGQPHLALQGRVAEVAQELGMKELALSLSHTQKLAVANVVVIPEQPKTSTPEALSAAEEQKVKLNCTFKDARKIVLQLDEALQEEQEALSELAQTTEDGE